MHVCGLVEFLKVMPSARPFDMAARRQLLMWPSQQWAKLSLLKIDKLVSVRQTVSVGTVGVCCCKLIAYRLFTEQVPVAISLLLLLYTRTTPFLKVMCLPLRLSALVNSKFLPAWGTNKTFCNISVMFWLVTRTRKCTTPCSCTGTVPLTPLTWAVVGLSDTNIARSQHTCVLAPLLMYQSPVLSHTSTSLTTHISLTLLPLLWSTRFPLSWVLLFWIRLQLWVKVPTLLGISPVPAKTT